MPAKISEAETIKIYAHESNDSIQNQGEHWSYSQNATSGNKFSDNLDKGAYTLSHGGKYYLIRNLLAFDTSILPDDAEILDAKLGVHVHTIHNNDNDSYAYVNVYEGIQASSTSLALSDFSKCGDSIDNPTAGATPVDIDTVTDDQYLDFVLNATGTGWIMPDGYTQLCVREGHDAEDQ